jgi:dihydroorotase
MKHVVPTVRQGGASVALVMVCIIGALLRKPNLTPPVTNTEMAIEYKKQLKELEPNVEFLMTLYLSHELTVEEIKKAKQAGIVGVKSYPKCVPCFAASNSKGRYNEL